jgi:hypothetical protein
VRSAVAGACRITTSPTYPVEVRASPVDRAPVSVSQRISFYAWCLLGCPLIGWSAAVFGTRGEGGMPKFVFLFIGVPALLAIAGGRVLHARAGESAVGAVAAGVLGGLTWFLTILWLISSGVIE